MKPISHIAPAAALLALLVDGCAVYPDRDDPDGGDPGDEMTIGQACERDEDCGDFYQCLIGPPGGYCVMPDPNDCFYDTECPDDTVCAPRTISEQAGLCLRTCKDAGDCRDGYVCAVVELFPGDPASPSSSQKVCWLPCYPGANQLCNDDPLISALYGECQPDYTCGCYPGWQINPATGRCR